MSKYMVIGFILGLVVVTALFQSFRYPYVCIPILIADGIALFLVDRHIRKSPICECKEPEFVTETKNHIFFECQRCRKEFQFKIKDFKKKGFRATNISPT